MQQLHSAIVDKLAILMSNTVTHLNSRSISSGVWLGVASRMDTKKTYVKKKIGLHAQKYDSCSRLNGPHNLGGPICPLDQCKNLHFGNE